MFRRLTATLLFVVSSAVCWAQSKPCIDLTLTPSETESHKLRSGLTETADRVMGVRPSQTVDSVQPVCPLTNSEKFRVFLRDSYSPFNGIAAGFNAAISQATQGRKGYGQGWDAYGSRYGAAFADSESSGLFQSFLLPALFHQDPRYFRLREGTFFHRSIYATTRVFVTHGDNGHHQFNVSEILGGFASAGLANVYYPSDRREVGDVLVRAGLGIVSDAGWNLFKEFGPDITHHFRHHKEAKSDKKDAGQFQNVPRP